MSNDRTGSGDPVIREADLSGTMNDSRQHEQESAADTSRPGVAAVPVDDRSPSTGTAAPSQGGRIGSTLAAAAAQLFSGTTADPAREGKRPQAPSGAGPSPYARAPDGSDHSSSEATSGPAHGEGDPDPVRSAHSAPIAREADGRTAVLSTSDRHGSLPPRPATARPAPRPEARPGRPEPRSTKGGRRTARLAVKRVNLWSVFTTSLALSTLLGIVLVVAVVVLYGVLNTVGAVTSVNNALAEVNVSALPARGDLLTYSLVLAAIDVVILTVLTTVLAGLYNLVSSFTGGVQVTLVDD